MNIKYWQYLSSLLRQLWQSRQDFFVPLFWQKALRVLKSSFLTKKISQQKFKENLARIRNRPFNIHFEVTNICNSNCIFCAYQYLKREKGIMPMEIYLKALKDFEEIGGGDVHFSCVVGDPLLDPRLIERIKIARLIKNINKIATITNCIHLNKVGVEKFLTSGISSAFISLAEFDEMIYEQVYRNRRYEEVFNNVLNLLKLNKQMTKPIEITIGFRSPRPLHKIVRTEDFKEVAKFKPKFDFTWSFDSWGGRIKKEDLPGKMKLRIVPLKKEPCIWLFDGPIIYLNGDVGLCGCRDFNADSKLVVGNIMNRHLIKIWNDKKVEAIRQSFYHRNIPKICRDCTAYRDLALFRTLEGSRRALLTEKRFSNSKFYDQEIL